MAIISLWPRDRPQINELRPLRISDAAFLALSFIPGETLFRGVGSAGEAIAEGVSSGWRWVFRGTEAERAIALKKGVELLKIFEADGGTFTRISSNDWGFYQPFANAGKAVINLAEGAGAGTLLEELFHHTQIKLKLLLGWSPEQIKVWLQAGEDEIEREAKGLVKALGFARELL